MNQKPTPPRRREKVLVVVRDGKLLEVYAEPHVNAVVVSRLTTPADSGDTATLIDEYMEATMPRCYRELYLPRNLRAIGNVETITPEKALDALYQVSILRDLRAERESKRPAPAAKPNPTPRPARPVVVNIIRRAG